MTATSYKPATAATASQGNDTCFEQGSSTSRSASHSAHSPAAPATAKADSESSSCPLSHAPLFDSPAGAAQDYRPAQTTAMPGASKSCKRADELELTATRSRSSSVSAAIKATFHRPSTSSGLPSSEQSPSSSGKSKNRLRAGTWKGSGNRAAVQPNKLELPSFDPSDRTPRASVYETFHDSRPSSDSTSTGSTANTSQLHLPAIDVSGGIAANKRRLFGRSNSIRDPAKQASPESSKEGQNLLRRIGSRTFFGAGLSVKDAMRSSDDLASFAVDGGSTSRSTEPSKLGPGTPWSRRKNRSKQVSDSDSVLSFPSVEPSLHALDGPPLPSNASVLQRERGSIESSRSTPSATSVSRIDRTSVGDATAGANLAPIHSNVGLPKRFSGWLLNMMGNEGSPSPDPAADLTAPATAAGAPVTSGPVDPDRESIRSATKSPSLGTSSSRADSPIKDRDAASNAPSSQATGAGPPNVMRTKAGSLLYSFTGGPNKAAKGSTQPAGSGSAGANGWITGGSGLDRAFRYFLDTEAESEEGIWLLGVWHGPRSPDRPTFEQPDAVGPTVEMMTTTSSAVLDATGTNSTDLQTSDSAGPRPTLDTAASRSSSSHLVDTPGSTSSSLPMSSPQLGCEDGFVLARNPPTPNTSPAKVRSVKPPSQPSSATNTIRSMSTDQSDRASSPATSSQQHSLPHSTDLDWQASFQADFSSRVWCTYRNQFAPISRDGTISEQAASAAAAAAEADSITSQSTGTDKAAPQVPAAQSRSWLGRKLTESSVGRDGLTPATLATAIGAGASPNLAPSPSTLGDKMGITGLWGRATAAAQAAGFSRSGLTTDAGWGCMLRTGQSLLANALFDTHLGRHWTRGPAPISQSKFVDQLSSLPQGHDTDGDGLREFRQARKVYATYVKLLSWFLDDPSPASPFGVHRMAREGKRLGKEVGEWFGPSTAAGAIKALVSEFPEAGIGVAVAQDGSVYLDEVRAAAVIRPTKASSSGRRRASLVWQRPVLILIGIRLGLEGVNPMYYDSVKATFSFRQSVGIAGGRPSSSYYFMGHQGNSLFYLDPHHVRPAVPLRFPPAQFPAATPIGSSSETCTPEDNEDEWWAHAYSEPQLATFHCDKVRRMPIKSLDPSMLLGFLCKDEADLQDLCSRVRSMPKAIFAFADTLPQWADDDNFDPSMESFSESSTGEPEADRDRDLEDDEGEDDSFEVSSEAKAQSSPAVASSSVEVRVPSELETRAVGFGRPSAVAETSRDFQGRHGPGMIAFPSMDRPALGPSDRSSTIRPVAESRHVSGSSEATARMRSRSRTGASTRRVSNNVLAAQPGKQVPSPVTGDESFSTVTFSDSEIGSAWEEVSEAGTVAGSSLHEEAPDTATLLSSVTTPDDLARSSDWLAGGPNHQASSDPVENPVESAAEELQRPVLVTSSPSGYGLNGGPLPSAAHQDQKLAEARPSTAHSPLRGLPRRRSRLNHSPCAGAGAGAEIAQHNPITPSGLEAEHDRQPELIPTSQGTVPALRLDSSDDDF